MTDDNHIDLSRRKVLGSLGAIGVASAGAGFGTSAYFNDEESFDNVITAGKLDLKVNYHSYWEQGMAGTGSLSETADGDVVSFELDDVKPGDSGIMAFCPRIDSNPAYLWLGGELTENHGNGLTEPEAEVDDTDGAGEGELGQSIDVTVSYCDLGDVGDNFDPEDIGEQTEIWSGSLADFLTQSQSGLPLDSKGEVSEDGGFTIPGDQHCFGKSKRDDTCLCLEWEIPTTIGNEIQSDSVGFDLQFYAEQCRHNDGEGSPYCTDLAVDLEEQYNQLLNMDLTDPYVLEIEVEDENGDPFTGEITASDHGNEEFVWVTDHLGTFDETPENRYGAYVELDFDDDGTAQISFGNSGDTDVSYLGLDVNEVTENIEVNVGEVIDGLEVTSMCVSGGLE